MHGSSPCMTKLKAKLSFVGVLTAASPRCGEFRARSRAQQQQIARDRAQRETARPRRLGARAVETEEAREFAMRLGGCDDLGQRGFHLRTVRIDDSAAAQRDREVRGAHEYAV